MSLMKKEKLVKTPSDSIEKYWTGKKLTIAEKFALYCEEHPWDVECKIYEI